MIIKVRCLTCKKSIHQVAVSRNAFRRSYEVDVWCHGQHSTLEITHDAALIHGSRPFQLEAFRPPTMVKLIIDRDMGDEDPKEPWQGETCQM